MGYQSINSNSNIRMRTGADEENRRGAKKLSEQERWRRSDRRDIAASDFEQDAKDSARTGYDTENQLSSNLITVTLAFVALISVALNSGDIIERMRNFQKYMILSALIVFCISVLMGLINYFRNMHFHKRIAILNEKIADQIEDSGANVDVRKLDRRAEAKMPSNTARSSVFLILQISLLCVGLALTVGFVGTILFL